MKILLDEDVPLFYRDALGHVLRGHTIDHVSSLGWTSKKDVLLLADARTKGYDLFVTNDLRQLSDPAETRAIKRSGLHHLRYEVKGRGIRALTSGLASLLVAFPHVVDLLEQPSTQRLFRARTIDTSRKARLEIVDPRSEAPRYWR